MQTKEISINAQIAKMKIGEKLVFHTSNYSNVVNAKSLAKTKLAPETPEYSMRVDREKAQITIKRIG